MTSSSEATTAPTPSTTNEAHEQQHDLMPINPARASELTSNLSGIRTRISALSPPRPVRLIAVSKLKPANDILALHDAPTKHLHFGENYYQELLTKSRLLPHSIRWHFIGALQTNKCKPLAEEVANLWAVESVDAVKKADQLEKGRKALVERLRQQQQQDSQKQKQDSASNGDGAAPSLSPPSATQARTQTQPQTQIPDPLRIFVQVNTSGEASKSGVSPGTETLDLCKHIRNSCPHLHLQGLMTIGAIARSQAASGAGPGQENEDFLTLRRVRDEVAAELKRDVTGKEGNGEGEEAEELELSMGMSEDFESAIRCGSDEVRVGSTIFGQRPAKQEAKITEDAAEGAG